MLVTANEGDTRDYDGFSEEERAGDLVLEPTAYPDALTLLEDGNLGRLHVTTANDSSAAGDLGPESLLIIPAADSPNSVDLLVVGNEVSGSTSIYRIGVVRE